MKTTNNFSKQFVKLSKCASMLIAIFMLYSCTNDIDTRKEDLPLQARKKIELKGDETKVNEAFVQNSFDFVKIVAKDKTGNFAVSPLSMQSMLSMLYNGAETETKAEFEQTLGLQGISMEDVNNYNQTIMEQLPTLDNTVTFASANGIWHKSYMTLQPEYATAMQSYFHASTTKLGDNLSESASMINKWVREHTNGMIDNIVGERDIELQQIIFANAMYFKGIWSSRFDEGATKKASFENQSGNTVKVSTMSQTNVFRHINDTDGTTLVELPYGNEAFSMILAMPAKGTKTADYLQSLSKEKWENMMSRLQTTATKIRLEMPKFSIKDKHIFVEQLKNWGLTKMFSTEADFSKLATTPYSLEAIAQHIAIEIDEQGAKAAAVTNTTVYTWAGESTASIEEIKINRPFVFFIREKSTGAILFVGRINTL